MEINRARIAILEAFRAYTDALIELYREVGDLNARPPRTISEARAAADRIRASTNRLAKMEWRDRLVEYEAHFPETARIREQLLIRHEAIRNDASQAVNWMQRQLTRYGRVNLSDEGRERDVARIANQLFLVRDLGIHFQRHEWPRTAPPGSIRMRPDGTLEIVEWPLDGDGPARSAGREA